jgi:dolichol kinase
MTDLMWTGIWLGILGLGLGGCVIMRALGMPSTYVRDLLHVGAGTWIIGWRWWSEPVLPVLIVVVAALVVALVPLVAVRVPLARRFRDSVSGDDERWDGLVLYTLAFTALTAIGLAGAPFPAAAGLLALSLGDGLGGAAGRRFGRHHYRWPWAKRKSLEGSAVVALGAGVGAVAAAALLDVSITPATVVALALVAALAEAMAPRSTDNALVPASVWVTATLLV